MAQPSCLVHFLKANWKKFCKRQITGTPQGKKACGLRLEATVLFGERFADLWDVGEPGHQIFRKSQVVVVYVLGDFGQQKLQVLIGSQL